MQFVPAAEGLSPCGTDGSGEPAPEHHFWERPGLLGLLRIAGANLYQQEEAAGPPLTAAQLEACPQLGAFFDPRHLLVLEQASEVRPAHPAGQSRLRPAARRPRRSALEQGRRPPAACRTAGRGAHHRPRSAAPPQAAVHITAVYDLTVPLTVEWLPLATPHRLSVKQLAFAVRKCQVSTLPRELAGGTAARGS